MIEIKITTDRLQQLPHHQYQSIYLFAILFLNEPFFFCNKHFDSRLLTARNIVRPQVNFKIPVDNSNSNPFEPRLKYKPNSIKPLAILAEYADDGNIESYLHPYEFELIKFEVPTAQLRTLKPVEPLPLDETPLIHIDTEDKLKLLLDDLSQVNEFAIDLEHHSYRTYQVYFILNIFIYFFKQFVIECFLGHHMFNANIDPYKRLYY